MLLISSSVSLSEHLPSYAWTRWTPRFFLLAFEWPRWWFSNLHRDVCVQGILLDLNQPVGQRADAVLLHGVLGVLDFIEPEGGKVD